MSRKARAVEIMWTGRVIDLEVISLEALMRHVSDTAERAYARGWDIAGWDCRESVIGTNWQAYTANGREVLVSTPVRNDHDRAAVPEQMRALFKQHNVRRYAVVYEAWIGTGDGPPSEDPDRTEAVYVYVEDASGETLMGARRIIRLVGCKPYLDRLVFANKGANGPFSGLLLATPKAEIRQRLN